MILLAASGGGIFVWSLCLVATALSALLAFGVPSLTPDQPNQPFRFCPTWLYLVFLLILFITIIPMPYPMSRLTGATRYAQNSLVVDALHEAHELGAIEHVPLLWFSTTRNRAGSMRVCVLLILAFGAAGASASLRSKDKRLILRFIVLLGTVVAVLGYLGQTVLPQGFTLWWYIPVPPALPGPMGGFTHANHFAGFIGVTGMVALAFVIGDAAQQRFFSMLLSLAALAAITFALISSLSRGAFVLYFASIALMTLFLLLRVRRVVVIPLMIVLLLGLAVLTGFALRNEEVRERVATLRRPFATSSFQSRSEAWLDALDVWTRYPVLGIGPNAFRMVYPIHRTSTCRAARKFAENEYVQFACEFGILGTLFAAAIGLVLLRRTITLIRDPSADGTIIYAACGGLLMALLHSGFEFIMHLPLYTILVFVLVGALFPPPRLPHHPYARMLPGLAGLFVAVLFWIFATPMHRYDSWGYLAGAKPHALTRPMIWSPTSQLSWRRFGIKIAEAHNATDPMKFFGERCLTQAARYDPNNAKLWLRLGKLRLELQDNVGARNAFDNVKSIKPWMGTPPVPET